MQKIDEIPVNFHQLFLLKITSLLVLYETGFDDLMTFQLILH